MSIRKWFGCHVEYNQSSSVSKALDELLVMYSEAVMKYLEIPDAQSLIDLIDRVPRIDLDIEKLMFLEWIQEEAFPYFNNNLLVRELVDTSHLKEQIEYVKFTLDQEMDFEYPDNVRSCLVDIVSFMPERIENAISIFKGIQEAYTFEEDYDPVQPARTRRDVTMEPAEERALLIY